MTPIEAAVKAGRQHVIALSASNADPRQFSQVEARIIIAAFLDAAAEDEDAFFKVKFALLENGATGSTPQAKAAILALKEAVG